MDYQEPRTPQVVIFSSSENRQRRSRASTLVLQPGVDPSKQGSPLRMSPRSPLRFECFGKDAATSDSPIKSKEIQGRFPQGQRLRPNSIPAPRLHTGDWRNKKRNFSATESPSDSQNDTEDRYWRTRDLLNGKSPSSSRDYAEDRCWRIEGPLNGSPTGESSLNSPMERLQIKHNPWILPARIAFLPRVRKGSLLAGQIPEKFHEQLGNHPVIIMSAPNSKGVVTISIVTSLGGQTIQEKYAKVYANSPQRAREFGRDFLLIKHGDAKPHDETPLLALRDGKEMARRSYVSVVHGGFYVQVEDLVLFRKNGYGTDSELFLDEASFESLIKYKDDRLLNQASVDRVKWPAGYRKPSEARQGINGMARLPSAASA